MHVSCLRATKLTAFSPDAVAAAAVAAAAVVAVDDAAAAVSMMARCPTS